MPRYEAWRSGWARRFWAVSSRALPSTPHDPLSAALIAAGLNVQVIGDARHPGRILSAIADAHAVDFSDLEHT